MIEPSLVTNADVVAQLHTLNKFLEQIASFIAHVTVGGASAHAIEWVKGKRNIAKVWALLSGRGKVITTAVVAGLGSLGITATFQHGADAGVYILTFSGLTWSSVGQHLWSFVQSWIAQQGWFQIVIQPKSVVGVRPAPASPEPPPVLVAAGASQ